MMVMDPLDGWKTQAEAAEILKCSQKTIGRMAAQKKLQRVMRRVPGEPEANAGFQSRRHRGRSAWRWSRSNRSRLKSGERSSPWTRQTSQDRFDLLAQLLADRISPARSVPVEQKVFLNLKEAAEYSGMPKAWLVREIKAGTFKAIKAGGWRIRRADLEQL